MFLNRPTVQILAWKSNLQREENRSTRRKTLGIRSQPTCAAHDSNLGYRSGKRDRCVTNTPMAQDFRILGVYLQITQYQLYSILVVLLILRWLLFSCFFNSFHTTNSGWLQERSLVIKAVVLFAEFFDRPQSCFFFEWSSKARYHFVIRSFLVVLFSFLL